MVGVDLVAIARIERLIGKYGVSFLQHFLRKSEISLCIKKVQSGEVGESIDLDAHLKNADISRFADISHFDISHFNVERIAGFYAAKEAISKALRCGISKNLTFKDIKLSKDSRGAPKAKLSKRAKKHFKVKKIYLSITHDKAQIRGGKGDKSNKNDLPLSQSPKSTGFAIAIAMIK